MRKWSLVLNSVSIGVVIVAFLRWRGNPSACPYSFRFSLELPHPFVTRSRLREILKPAPGERMLEVGPGTGYYSLDAARWVGSDGTLDVLDIQQEMLDHILRRARESSVPNIVPARGDAQELPCPDDRFDAAYLSFVLGEVPDQDAALRELRRVLKPGGRLVAGEALTDPHMVSFEKLRAGAEAAGLRFERRLGGPLGYYVRFAA
ncbi:MAG: class I SAM-dependent methyltransferase [Rubrobacteraceae bacterium]